MSSEAWVDAVEYVTSTIHSQSMIYLLVLGISAPSTSEGTMYAIKSPHGTVLTIKTHQHTILPDGQKTKQIEVSI